MSRGTSGGSRLRRVAGIAAAVLVAGVLYPPSASAAPSGAAPGRTTPVSVRIIGINDLHGNLQPPTGSSGRVSVGSGATVDAGGAAYVATHVK